MHYLILNTQNEPLAVIKAEKEHQVSAMTAKAIKEIENALSVDVLALEQINEFEKIILLSVSDEDGNYTKIVKVKPINYYK